MDNSNLDHKALCVYCFDVLVDALRKSKTSSFPDVFKNVFK